MPEQFADQGDSSFNPSQVGYKQDACVFDLFPELEFQSLTGRLQTTAYLYDAYTEQLRFQSLTGRLQTLSQLSEVSI